MVALLTESRGQRFDFHRISRRSPWSLSSRRAWIEIYVKQSLNDAIAQRRSPHGERGLKYLIILRECESIDCRSPHGERGLKFYENKEDYNITRRRSPHGERGLKYFVSRRLCRY